MNPDRNANLVAVSVHSNEPSRRLTANENDILNGIWFCKKKLVWVMLTRNVHFVEAQEVRNERALAVYNRVQHKLTGTQTCSGLSKSTLPTWFRS